MSTINPVITTNRECLIIEACVSFINLKVGISLNYGILLCFVSFLAFLDEAMLNCELIKPLVLAFMRV